MLLWNPLTRLSSEGQPPYVTLTPPVLDPRFRYPYLRPKVAFPRHFEARICPRGYLGPPNSRISRLFQHNSSEYPFRMSMKCLYQDSKLYYRSYNLLQLCLSAIGLYIETTQPTLLMHIKYINALIIIVRKSGNFEKYFLNFAKINTSNTQKPNPKEKPIITAK